MEIQEVDLLQRFICNPLILGASSYSNTEGLEEVDLAFQNYWGFDYFTWQKIKKEFGTVERLYAAIQDLYKKIEDLKKTFQDQAVPLSDFQVEYNEDAGVSGSYLLIDDEGHRKYLIKPLDEDAGCIHGRWMPTPFLTSPIRKNIPLYLSSMREVLAYRQAVMIGVESVVPKTQLGIIKSEYFHDFSESIHSQERKHYSEQFGLPDKEKLCSVQEYIPNAKSLFEALHELQMLGLSDKEILERFSQEDFEEANILIWTTYDTDAHMGNFLVYRKGTDEIGNEILGLKKIDNGLAFPDKNQNLRNNLYFLPNANEKLSQNAREKIWAIDIDQLSDLYKEIGLDDSIFAMRQRIEYLQKIIKDETLTIKEINAKLSNIGKK